MLWLTPAMFLCGLIVIGMGLVGAVDGQVIAGTKIFGGGLVVYAFAWFLSSRARCPLCMVPPLHPKSCQKHRRAKRLFGSHRLRVATTVLFRDFFQCPYCGEATKIAARVRSSRRED